MKIATPFHASPKNFGLDVAGVCNLHCTFCPEGLKINQQPMKFMSFQDFVKLFNSLPKDLTSIGLTNWSEPFLNKDIVDIIQYVKKNRPQVEIWVSSNIPKKNFQGAIKAKFEISSAVGHENVFCC